ncbi:MerR family transcriptional regulator [Agreia sp.]|uniref:MerR family transcriptional regulator n=1 Tax=Agreia sp. TaxID=1872416 RepID=UPI0035BBA0F2
MAKEFLIGEVSEETGLGVHTLRFYEREGLLPGRVERDGSGRRVYTEVDVEWLRMCMRFRSIGMPVGDVRHYAELVAAGPGNERERMELLRAHEARVRQELAGLVENLSVIEAKARLYAEYLEAGKAGRLWTGEAPTCLAVEAAVGATPWQIRSQPN